MPEEGKTIDNISSDDQRAARIRWVIFAGTIFVVAILAAYALLYIASGSLPVLVDGAGLALGLACLGVAFWLVRQGRLDAAGYWMLATWVVAYSFSEMAWQGETLLNVAGGVLLIAVVGSLVLPRRWGAWLVAAGMYGACILLINLLELGPRHEILVESPLAYYFDLGTTVLLAVVGLWRLFRALLLSTIRMRLLVASVLLVLLPAAVISVVSAVTGFQSGREQVTSQLKLVADFRQAQIDAWKGELQINLAAALREGSTLVYAQRALAESQGEVGFLVKRPLEQSLHMYNYRTHNFDELFLLSLDGRKIATSGVDRDHYLLPETYDVIVQQDFHGDQVYFEKGLEGSYQVLYSPAENEWGGLALQPVADAQGRVVGVLAGYISLDKLSGIVLEETGMGETVKTYLVGPDHVLLTNPEPGEEVVYVRSQGVDAVLKNHASVDGTFEDYRNVPVVGVYRWLPELEVALVAEQEQSEAFGALYRSMVLSVGVALVSMLLAVVVSLLVARSIAGPLSDLTETATRVAAGDLSRVAKVEREDEIGAVGQAFNNMAARLHDLIGGLEERVAARTHELERRSTYLEASIEVARAVSSILDTDQLVRQVVGLVRQRFELYYVGLFLVDEIGEWAVLRAGTGEAGRMMLARGHRVKIGEGMVGWSIANAQARIALDIGEDGVYLATDELPATRSAAALPLCARGQVIGALSVQSDRPAAFDEDTITVFQTLADQVAIALENARLFAESQAALEAAGRAYGEMSHEAWINLLRLRPGIGYRSDAHGISIAERALRPEMVQALQEKGIVLGSGGGDGGKIPLAVPIKVRGEAIGVLDTYKPAEAGEWTDEELALLEALTNQLGEALESARLYQDTQRRAAREQLVSHIVNRMQRAIDMDTLMQTTIREVAAALGASSAFVQLSTPSMGDEDEDVG